MAFGDISVSVPNVFGEVQELEGNYVSAGPNSAISVTPAMSIDLLPEEWNEEIAAGILDGYYGSTYSNMELSSFSGKIDLNGNPAVYYAFYGTNASGTDRLVQIVYFFDMTNEAQYVINLVHNAESDFFTPEVGGAIINSIKLAA